MAERVKGYLKRARKKRENGRAEGKEEKVR
jgi:hypothetical protein